MGIANSFVKEDRVNVKFSDFYNLVKGCTERDMILNGAKCNIPHRYIREMVSGQIEIDLDSNKDNLEEKEQLAYTE